MWIFPVFVLIIIVFMLYEFRIRRPDQIVIGEKKSQVIRKQSRIYARHFNLPIPSINHSEQIEIETEAKGKLALKTKISISITASTKHLNELVNSGGWNTNLVSLAAKELIILIEGLIKDQCEKLEIEKLKAETLTKSLETELEKRSSQFGLQLVSLKVQSIEPLDENITEALRQRESARILEDTQKETLKAKIATAQEETQADEKIAVLKHQLELKKTALKQQAFEQEMILDKKQAQEEIKHRQMQLDFERKEMELLKENPELLILSPQMTRLAEASQSLKNARTVVSLSPNELDQGSQLLVMLQSFLQNMLQKSTPSEKTENA